MSNRPVTAQSFGSVPGSYDSAWYSLFVAQLTRRLSLLAGPNTVQPQILLQSPNGKVWKVEVNNSGTLTSTEVTRGSIVPPL